MDENKTLDENKTAEARGLVAGLLIGGLVGAAAALLMAPQSGQRTRKLIARTAEDWTEAAGQSLEAASEDAKRVAGRAARDAGRVARTARRKAEDMGERVAGVVEQGRERLERS